MHFFYLCLTPPYSHKRLPQAFWGKSCSVWMLGLDLSPTLNDHYKKLPSLDPPGSAYIQHAQSCSHMSVFSHRSQTRPVLYISQQTSCAQCTKDRKLALEPTYLSSVTDLHSFYERRLRWKAVLQFLGSLVGAINAGERSRSKASGKNKRHVCFCFGVI